MLGDAMLPFKTFLGIIVDRSETVAEMPGIRRDTPRRLLYVRLSQDWVPDLQQDDIVIDEHDDKWKITERFDYDEIAGCKVFGVSRVEP